MEMIVKMKKEKRKKVEEDYLTQEQQKRLELRKELAETLKASIKKWNILLKYKKSVKFKINIIIIFLYSNY